MACPEFEERLLAYDELPSEERGTIGMHVTQCAECRSFLSALNEVDTVLTAAFGGSSVSPAFAGCVMRELQTNHRLRRPSLVPEILDAAGWAGILAILLWLTTFFVPGLDFSIPLATAIGAILLLAGLWIAYRCYGDLTRC